MSFDTEVSWNDPSIATTGDKRKVERFLAKQGKTTRITVLTERPIRTWTHYKKPYGYFACLKAEGLECVACGANDRPSEKFMCNILVYPDGTEPGSNWDASQLKVMLWQPGPKVFGDIRQIVKNWGPLQNYDLEITCTNEQYQHLNVVNTPKCLWKEHPSAEAIAKVIEASQYDLKQLSSNRKETVDEVRAIWTTPNMTREMLKQHRDKNKGTTAVSYAAAAPAQEPAPAAPAALPNFADLLRQR